VKLKPLVVGLVEGEGGLNRRFLLMAGIGLDGDIVRGVGEPEKRLFKRGPTCSRPCAACLTGDGGRFAAGGRVCR